MSADQFFLLLLVIIAAGFTAASERFGIASAVAFTVAATFGWGLALGLLLFFWTLT